MKKASELQTGDCFQKTALGMWRLITNIEKTDSEILIFSKEGLHQSGPDVLYNTATANEIVGATQKQLATIILPVTES